MTQPRNTLAPVFALPALLLVFGCIPSRAEFPKGTYSAASEGDEQWEVVFAEQGRFRVTRNGEAAVEGQYTATADRVVFSNETGPYSCGSETGTYKWQQNGHGLILTTVEEPCNGRPTVMQRLVPRK